MYAYVRILLPGGDEAHLGHGDIIGRIWNAAVYLDDPRISEAHAMVSLRGNQLYLLGLRGRFSTDNKACDQLVLKTGQIIHLTRSLKIEVLEVCLPEQVLALCWPKAKAQVLYGTSSLRIKPTPELIPGRNPKARAILWEVAGQWRYQIASQKPISMEVGDSFIVDEIEFTLCSAKTAAHGKATLPDGSMATPLHLICRWDTVHIQRQGYATFVLGGIPAKILSELIAMEVPVDWHLLAASLWPGIHDRSALRKRLDVALARMRRKLREAGIRPDLARSNRAGSYELYLHPNDHCTRQD